VSPELASYARVAPLVDERSHGAYPSCDEMTGFSTRYGNGDAQAVALELDAKIERLMQDARDKERSRGDVAPT
jgi:hypothetical protein